MKRSIADSVPFSFTIYSFSFLTLVLYVGALFVVDIIFFFSWIMFCADA